VKRLSASGLRLAETCPASLHLPEIWTESGDAAEAGTGRHLYLEHLQTMTRDEALALVPADAPWRSTCEGIDPEEVPRGRAEVGVALDPDDGSAHWLARGRDGTGYASVPGHWITGTIDLLVETEQWVVDWKGVERVDDPEINLQLGAYGLIAARLHGWDWVRISAAHISPDGRISWRHGVLDAWALAEVEERILAVVAAARAASREQGPYRRGVHCTRCSGLAACPTAMGLVAAMVAGGPSTIDTTGMLPADLASAYETAAVVEAAVALTKRAVEDATWALGTLPLPSGGSLQVVERSRKSVDPERGVPVLRELFGVDAVDAELEVKISNSSVKKLAKRVAPPRQGSAFVTELWTRLASDGAMRTSRSQSVSLVRARRADRAPQVVVEEE